MRVQLYAALLAQADLGEFLLKLSKSSVPGLTTICASLRPVAAGLLTSLLPSLPVEVVEVPVLSVLPVSPLLSLVAALLLPLPLLLTPVLLLALVLLLAEVALAVEPELRLCTAAVADA